MSIKQLGCARVEGRTWRKKRPVSFVLFIPELLTHRPGSRWPYRSLDSRPDVHPLRNQETKRIVEQISKTASNMEKVRKRDVLQSSVVCHFPRPESAKRELSYKLPVRRQLARLKWRCAKFSERVLDEVSGCVCRS
jgi:hypothetical protein